MSAAEKIVDSMLEAYDEHVKAYDRIKTFDKALNSFRDLYRLRKKANGVYSELGRALAYERALAQVGVNKEDVSHPLYGGSLTATDNFKGTRPAKICRNRLCALRSEGGRGTTYFDNVNAKYQPATAEKCTGCEGPLEAVNVPIPPRDLRGKFARYIFGIETNDGRRVWFNEPVPPASYDWAED